MKSLSIDEVSWAARLASWLSLILMLGAAQAQPQLRATGLSAVTASGEVPLEPSVGTSKVKRGNLAKAAVGVASQAFLLEIPGDRSPVRIRASDVQAFLVRTADTSGVFNGLAPELRLLVAKKGKPREFVTSGATTYVAVTKIQDTSPRVLVDLFPYDDHTVKIVPKVMPLLPGEYAFNTGDLIADDSPQRYAKTGVGDPNNLGRFRVYCFAIE